MAMILNLSSIIPAKLTKRRHVVKCESRKLEVGSPIIVIQAPKLLKTASSVPCLRANAGLVNPGDVGRIVSRKPMDVWAVRLSIGKRAMIVYHFRMVSMKLEYPAVYLPFCLSSN
ncbi:uncharacterized protein LOC121795394 [Salvia splendens]|uniref:uncharacterized protein LOC121795394 n=1 Tax=Salvia splendens TaxID=180675 RepID=UPI001C25C5B4|nr:uncharacterized protein LOC121795394 [Salvia splendens]